MARTERPVRRLTAVELGLDTAPSEPQSFYPLVLISIC
jgi:hypothetical protein